MKSIKYLLLGLAVGLMSTSCEKRTIEFDWTESADKASFQVFNMNLMSTSPKNDIDYLYINGKEYTNNHSSLIPTYNFAPSGVGAFYTIDPCSSMTISMKTEQSETRRDENGAPIKDENGNPFIDYTTEEVYNNVVEHNFEAGKKYQIFVYDYTKAPVVIDEPGAPIQELDNDSLGNATHSGARLYNFMFDAPGVPTTAVVQWAAKYKKGDTEYYTKSDWVPFGQASNWFNVFVDREDSNGSGLNSSGYSTIWLDLLISYDGGATSEILIKNDYWTYTYIGSAYYFILVGDKDNSIRTNELRRFIAL